MSAIPSQNLSAASLTPASAIEPGPVRLSDIRKLQELRNRNVVIKNETTSAAASILPGMQASAFRQIAEIAALPAGWDGEDADPLTGYAVARACYLIDLIRVGTGGVEPIASMPLDHGGLQIEWQLPGGILRYEAEIGPDGELSLARVDFRSGERQFTDIGRMPLRDAATRIAQDLVDA